MTRSDRCWQARSRREKFNIPDLKAKPYSTKEGRAEGRKRQREEKRARDKIVRGFYGEPEPEFEDDDKELPKESVFSNPGLPADFNKTATMTTTNANKTFLSLITMTTTPTSRRKSRSNRRFTSRIRWKNRSGGQFDLSKLPP